MTHEELCLRAIRWLRGTCRCNPVYSRNASCSEIPDAIGWTSCYKLHGSIVVECKTSVSDFHADKRKYVVWRNIEYRYTVELSRMTDAEAKERGYEKEILPRMGDRRFYFCEDGVLPFELIEKHAPDHGLVYRQGNRIKIVRPAPQRDLVNKDAEIRYLRFAIINEKRPNGVESPASQQCGSVVLAN